MSGSVSTQYRYIVRRAEICGGRPIVDGTRTPVQSIVGYYKLGLSVEEILEGLPQLTAAQVFEALSYYHDHVAEMEADADNNRVETVMQRYGLAAAPDGQIVPTSVVE